MTESASAFCSASALSSAIAEGSRNARSARTSDGPIEGVADEGDGIEADEHANAAIADR